MLALSSWYPHKNIGIIPKVIEVLQEKGYEFIRFIVTLPQIDFNKLEINAKHKQQIINVGIVKIEEGASLYQECDALFLPTLLECFSASYAEAMIMEKPILQAL